jgi:hypothetical protein
MSGELSKYRTVFNYLKKLFLEQRARQTVSVILSIVRKVQFVASF